MNEFLTHNKKYNSRYINIDYTVQYSIVEYNSKQLKGNQQSGRTNSELLSERAKARASDFTNSRSATPCTLLGVSCVAVADCSLCELLGLVTLRAASTVVSLLDPSASCVVDSLCAADSLLWTTKLKESVAFDLWLSIFTMRYGLHLWQKPWLNARKLFLLPMAWFYI